MAPFNKPYLEREQLVVLLREKGMRIGDETCATECLGRIGYYRLSGYWHPFKLRGDGHGPEDAEKFREGTSMESILALYEFDSRLRSLVLEGVEAIEISLRVQVAELMGRRHPFAYLMPEMMHGGFTRAREGGMSDHATWLHNFNERMHRPGEEFVRHLIGKYGRPLPIWAAVELWDLSQTCFFISGMKHADRMELASRYEVDSPDMLQSWLKCIKGVRNHAAHHGRLWNRNLAAQPSLPAPGRLAELDFIASDQSRRRLARICCPLMLMAHMIRRIDPTSGWPDKMRALIREFPEGTGLSRQTMGFPENW